MKKFYLLNLLSCFLLGHSTVYAGVICPPINWVRHIKFIQAFTDPYDRDCWNFISEPFSYSGKVWTIFFGTFITNISNRQEALNKANSFLQNARIVTTNPQPISIPDHLLCDYMPPGSSFWLSAITPPESL